MRKYRKKTFHLTKIGSLKPDFFAQYEILCEVIACICLITCVASLATIGTISFSRYVKLCQSQHYDRFFAPNKTLLYCFLSWLLGVLIDIPNFIGKQFFRCIAKLDLFNLFGTVLRMGWPLVRSKNLRMCL